MRQLILWAFVLALPACLWSQDLGQELQVKESEDRQDRNIHDTTIQHIFDSGENTGLNHSSLCKIQDGDGDRDWTHAKQVALCVF